MTGLQSLGRTVANSRKELFVQLGVADTISGIDLVIQRQRASFAAELGAQDVVLGTERGPIDGYHWSSSLSQQPLGERAIEQQQLILNGLVTEQTIRSFDAVFVGGATRHGPSKRGKPELAPCDESINSTPHRVTPAPVNLAEAVLELFL